MSLVPRLALAAIALASAGASMAAPEFSGHVRPEYVDQQPGSLGPLVQAASLMPGVVTLPVSGATLETELRGSGDGFAAIATVRQERLEGDRLRNRASFNELTWSGGGASWQFSAGKKIVGWDVGYGFRPNDVVEQETRRTLLTVTPEGRPLLMAEHFDATTAWSFVLVNPTQSRDRRGAEEPAFAMRVYQRDGAVDWHGFARYGAHSGASLGAAAAWVASDALELHASLRYLNSADNKAIDNAAIDASSSSLVRANPWLDANVRHTSQLLVGGTWTNAEQLSLLAEAWWDGTALSNAQWDAWNARNRQLAGLIGSPAPVGAVAGNLAWQGSAFNASSSLRRANLFVRASWTEDKWQPALDMLYTPADSGRIVTASLGWQGDRIRVDAGLRLYGGPGSAVLVQTGSRRVAYCAGTWTF